MDKNCAAQPTKIKITFLIVGALLGSFALILQLYLAVILSPKLGISYIAGFIRFFCFMTVWTNILVTLHFLMPLLAPVARLTRFLAKPIVQTGTLVYILIVCVIYHFLLANLWNPQGFQAITDISLHYLVPIYYLIFYIFFAPKGMQEYKNSFKWLVYPLIYVIFSMIYGAITKEYLYPFIDLPKLGFLVLIRNILMLSLFYYLFGLLIIFLDKKTGKAKYQV